MGKETISRTTFVKGVTACVVVAASLGITQIGEYSIQSSEEAATVVSSGTASYTPGTYTATAAGISSDVTVECTFDESSITAIEVDVSGETAGLGADIGDEMISQFLTAQSSAVDGVSGATVTSDALKTALEDCIAQATGGSSSSDDTESAETEASSEADTETAAETETEPSAETETEALVAEAVSEADTVAAADTETEAASESADSTAASAGAIYTPGTYTATATGMESDITVTITVDETSILSVEYDVSGETAGIGADIGTEVGDQIVDAQSADVEGVSGATVTSTAVKEAAAACLEEAAVSSEITENAETELADTETESADTEAVTEAEAADTEAVTEAEAADTEAVTEAEAADMEAVTEAEAADMEAVTEAEAADTEAVTEAADIEDSTEAASEDSSEDSTAASSAEAIYTPGTYTATAAGIESDVIITITVDENTILSVGYDVSGETDGIGAAIGPEISEQILTAQSADVDGVSGATVTSTAVMEAAADCLAQAMAGSSLDTESEVETELAETEGLTEAETELIETELPTEAEIASLQFIAGTYTAVAEGYSGEITVTMTFDESSILEMDADVSGETSTYSLIDEDVIRQVLDAQSVDVDGISGATVTSDAILEAAADCIEQAQSDASSAIIGGADESTEIYLTENESETELSETEETE